MKPVSNVDRIVQLLRQRLDEKDRRLAGKSSDASAWEAAPPRGVEALAAVSDTRDRHLRRTFIQTLLADQLGIHLINDAQFQQIVSRVTDAIEEDQAAVRLLSRLIDDMKSRLAAKKVAKR